jgi:hypothetical protein
MRGEREDNWLVKVEEGALPFTVKSSAFVSKSIQPPSCLQEGFNKYVFLV